MAVVVTLCERCGRISVDKIVHDDLYHPVPRRRADPIEVIITDDPVEPAPALPEPEVASSGN